jgi:hypothetical protein
MEEMLLMYIALQPGMTLMLHGTIVRKHRKHDILELLQKAMLYYNELVPQRAAMSADRTNDDELGSSLHSDALGA